MSSSEDKFPHLWIPESEITPVEYKPTARSHDLPIHHAEHGQKLLAELGEVTSSRKEKESSLGREILVFKVKLQEQEKFQNKQRQQLLTNNGIHINALKDERTAIVSTSPKDIAHLKSKVHDYQLHKTTPDLQFVDYFAPFTQDDKQSKDLKALLSRDALTEEFLDLQIQLIPNLDSNVYEVALLHLIEKIQMEEGELVRDPYYLSDGTPVVRVKLLPSSLSYISDDDAVLRLERTNFFIISPSEVLDLRESSISLSENVDIDELPVVTVLDSGVNFSLLPNLQPLIYRQWVTPGVTAIVPEHGTSVASRVIFGDDIDKQLIVGELKPRARIIDACITDGQPISEDVFIERVKAAVEAVLQDSKIFNLSFNTTIPIDSDSISILAFELDVLMLKYDIQFIISSGNHVIWRHYNNIADVLDDDDTRIASPAESFLALTVGAINRDNDIQSLTGRNEVSPYSRIGPGFARNQKPDLMAYGGNLPNEGAPAFGPNGHLVKTRGTSFSAPVVSGDFAEVLNNLPMKDLLLAKALLIHTATPTWDLEGLNDDDKAFYAKIYGNGLSNPERALLSTGSSVTFVCRGELNRLTKQRVNFWMPDILSAQPGKNTARVSVTCVSQPPIDRTKGEEYLGAFVSASLHKIDSKNKLVTKNPTSKTGRVKWQPWQSFSHLFSTFNPGDWQIWLQLSTRWDTQDDTSVPYALAVTIEDPSGQLPVYQRIQEQVAHRFQPMTGIQIRI